jgi:DNA-binding CsgD family transcriptional regulator
VGKAKGLTLADARELLQIVGEVRELGLDPVRWRLHFIERLTPLLGGIGGGSFQMTPNGDARSPFQIAVVSFPAPQLHRVWAQYFGQNDIGADPTYAAFAKLGKRTLVFTREELVDDAPWYCTPFVDTVRRAADADHFVQSSRELPACGVWDHIAIWRAWGARPFGDREKQILDLAHGELERLWNDAARRRAARDPLATLPPRLRQVADALVAGETEKSLAFRVGLSKLTVRSYVKLLYTRLGVTSRGELMSRCIPSYDFVPRLTPPVATTTRQST